MSAEDWNRQVDNFDVEGLADQLASVNAPYYWITLGQNSGHYCAPNATYDRYVGISPSKCSSRDLIADLYEALTPKGIRLLVYLPAGAPDQEPTAVEALEWKKGPFRNRAFQVKWEAVIREWSERWGDKVHGWWFDGCFWPEAMYRHPDAPNFASFSAAAKAGNPNSLVAFNPGIRTPSVTLSEFEDITAGELDFALVVGGKYPEESAASIVDRMVFGSAQFHILTFIGEWWGAKIPRFSADFVAAYTDYINSHGGVITWDVGIETSGLIPPVYLERLGRLNASNRV